MAASVSGKSLKPNTRRVRVCVCVWAWVPPRTEGKPWKRGEAGIWRAMMADGTSKDPRWARLFAWTTSLRSRRYASRRMRRSLEPSLMFAEGGCDSSPFLGSEKGLGMDRRIALAHTQRATLPKSAARNGAPRARGLTHPKTLAPR